jgi:hypothetical protein
MGGVEVVNKKLPVEVRKSELATTDAIPPSRLQRILIETIRGGAASIPLLGPLMERLTFGIDDKIQEEKFQEEVKTLLRNLQDSISNVELSISEADAVRIARRLIDTGQFSAIEKNLDNLVFMFSAFERKLFSEIQKLQSERSEIEGLISAGFRQVHEQLARAVRQEIDREKTLDFLSISQGMLPLSGDLDIEQVKFIQKLAIYERSRFKGRRDRYIVDTSELVGFITPSRSDMGHFLATACNLELGPQLFVSRATLSEVAGLLRALASNLQSESDLKWSDLTEKVSAGHVSRLISSAYQLERLHYLLKRGRFDVLDEGFLDADKSIRRKFEVMVASIFSSLHQEHPHFRNANAISVDAYNIALLRFSETWADATGGAIGLLTRDRTVARYVAGSEYSDNVLFPWEYAFGLFEDRRVRFGGARKSTTWYGLEKRIDAKTDELIALQLENPLGGPETSFDQKARLRYSQSLISKIGPIKNCVGEFADFFSAMCEWLAEERIWDLQASEKAKLAKESGSEARRFSGDLAELIFETSLEIEMRLSGNK